MSKPSLGRLADNVERLSQRRELAGALQQNAGRLGRFSGHKPMVLRMGPEVQAFD